jgi:hypothetical protein
VKGKGASHVNEGSHEQDYAKTRRRTNSLGGLIFVVVTISFVLTATQLFSVPWTECWVAAGGLLVGFTLALAFSIAMDYALGREYGRLHLSLWEYALLRFRYLFVLFLVPMTVTVVVDAVVTTFYQGPFVFSVLLLRSIAFVVVVVFAGFVLPYLFGRITGAERVGRDTRSLVNDIAGKSGLSSLSVLAFTEV